MRKRISTGIPAIPVDFCVIRIGQIARCRPGSTALIIESRRQLQAAVVEAAIQEEYRIVDIDISRSRRQGQLTIDTEQGRIEGGIVRLSGREDGQKVIGADVARIDVGIQSAIIHCDRDRDRRSSN